MFLRNCVCLAAILIFPAVSAAAQDEITVPDYSFSGKEITGFAVRPSYTSVNFDFAIPSKMDVYLQKRHAEFRASDKKDYSAEEPGFMYSGPVSTSVSSVFVGEKAYRNNIVKTFLRGDYIGVVNSCDKYSSKIADEELKRETELLYALSLYETGRRKEAIDILAGLAGSSGEYAEIAMDTLFDKLYNASSYDAAEKAASGIKRFTPYSLAKRLGYLNDTNRYEDIIAALDAHPGFESEYPDFAGLRAAALYFQGEYEKAAALEKAVRGKPAYPLVLDAMIMTGKADEASSLAAGLPPSDARTSLLAKIRLHKGDYKGAASLVPDIKNDEEKLALFFYAVSNFFEKVPSSFLESFSFADRQNNDYVNYYAGIKRLADKDYAGALGRLSLVTFAKELTAASYFYQGMASVHVDPSRAEWNFMRFISAGGDKEKIKIAKFMVAQLYFLKNKRDEALMLVDDCENDYCSRLKADIFLAKGQYKKSAAAAAGLNDDRAVLIRATAYYNLLRYDKSLEELGKIKNKTSDAAYLYMMSLFKTGRVAEAMAALEKNKNDARILSAGAEQLILAGEGKKALKYIESIKDVSPSLKLERAKLLHADGRNEEAAKVYNSLIEDGENLYDSIQGLYQIAASKNKGKDFVASRADYIEKSASFPDKDKLVSQFAAYALEAGEPNLAIRYVNYFTDKYKDSPYGADVYRTRAKLFKFTGRYENCVSDADTVLKLVSSSTEDDALFIKAQCLEEISAEKAVDLYRTMAREGGRFYEPSSGRLALLSGNADEVLAASERLKSVSPEIYKDGVIRFLEIADNESYLKHYESIAKLASSGPDDVRSAAMWRIAGDYYAKGVYDEAARRYLKGYYLFPGSSFAAKNLEGAKKAYEVRGMKKEAAGVGKLMKKPSSPEKKTDKKTASKNTKK